MQNEHKEITRKGMHLIATKTIGWHLYRTERQEVKDILGPQVAAIEFASMPTASVGGGIDTPCVRRHQGIRVRKPPPFIGSGVAAGGPVGSRVAFSSRKPSGTTRIIQTDWIGCYSALSRAFSWLFKIRLAASLSPFFSYL